MPNIYVKATALSNVCGRVDYISSDEKQENLVAVHSEVDSQFWHDLSAHCRKAAAEAGHDKVCEGREWHGGLPNEYAEIYKGREEVLAKEISDLVKEVTGTENVTALHWNAKKNNFHFHVVVSENPEVNETTYGAVLSRNTYFDADGKRSTKSKCVDPETRELQPGCELFLKGDRKATFKRFGAKEDLRRREVTEQIKDALVEKFNYDLGAEEYRKFIDDGFHLRQQHVGKGLPKEIEDAIKAKNKAAKEFNETVDELLDLSVKDGELANIEAKKSIQTVRDDMKKWALTDRWTECVQFYQNKLNNIVERVKAYFQEREPEPEPEQPKGIDALIESVKERQTVPPIRRTNRAGIRQTPHSAARRVPLQREEEFDIDMEQQMAPQWYYSDRPDYIWGFPESWSWPKVESYCSRREVEWLDRNMQGTMMQSQEEFFADYDKRYLQIQQQRQRDRGWDMEL